jgi:hypothetical protein
MAETLIDASMEVCLEVNVKKTKYILVSHYQNQNLIQEEINRRLKTSHAYEEWRIIPEDTIPHSHRYVNLKPYLVMLVTIQSRTFCLLICFQITYKFEYI